MQKLATVTLDSREIGTYAILQDITFTDEIRITAFHFNERTQELTYYYALYDPISLEQTMEFEPFLAIDELAWEAPDQPQFFPLSYTFSDNGKYIAYSYSPTQPTFDLSAFNIRNRSREATEENFVSSTILILDEELEVIYQKKVSGNVPKRAGRI